MQRLSSIFISFALVAATTLPISGCVKQRSSFVTLGELEFGTQTSSDQFKLIEHFDAGKQPYGTTSKYTVHLRNRGDVPITLIHLTLDPPSSAEHFSIQNKCESELPGRGESPCPIDIFFAPATTGSLNTRLLVTYDDGKGAILQSILPINATATNLAFLKFETDTLDLENDTVGYTVSRFIRVLYNGTRLTSRGITIQPAKGVTISNPTNAQFTIDRAQSTCPEIINQDCLVKVNFKATSAGPMTGSFALNYFNGAESLKITASLVGTGTPALQLAQLTAPAASFGNVVFNPAEPKSVTVPVSFTGSVPADNIVITGPANAAFTLSTDPAKTTCQSGQDAMINGNCALFVSFNPSERTAYSDRIIISYRSNGQSVAPLTIPLTGNGVNPALLTASMTSVGFGSSPVYKSRPNQTITLRNTGEAALNGVLEFANSNGVDFSYSPAATCSTLAPNATCNLTVGFRPLSAASLSSILTLTYFDGRVRPTITLNLTGEGTAPVVVEGNGSVNFGNVIIGKPAADLSASLSIYGTTRVPSGGISASPATLDAPFSFSGGTFPGGGTCSAEQLPRLNASCNFKVSLASLIGYTPDVQVTKPFTINYSGENGNGSGTISYSARVTPRNPPALSFQTPPADFGTVSVNNSKNLNFVIKNDSLYFGASFKSVTITGTGAAAYTIASNGCSGGVSSNQGSCTITVKFKPSADGVFDANLQFTYNNQLEDKIITTSFSGTGSPDVTLIPSATTVDFGNVYIGDAIPSKPVTLSYFGTNSWTSSLNPTDTSPFTFDSSGCGSPANCIIQVSFTPTVAGSITKSVDFEYSPGVPSPAKFTLTLKGNPILRAPVLAIANTAFPKVMVGNSLEQTITVTNSGNTSASAVTFPTLDGIFSYATGGEPGASGQCALNGTLAAGASCTLKLRFSPTTAGATTLPFAISFANDANAGAPLSKTATLSGTGTLRLKIFAGGFETCLINELGKAACWGKNSSGQLGQGTTQAGANPQNAPTINFGASINSVQQIAIGSYHACAIVSSASQEGVVTCWGSNDAGRLGLGSALPAMALKPLDETGNLYKVDLGTDSSSRPKEAVKIAAGFEHTCALLNTGEVKCWGGNTSGQLGIGSTSSIGLAGTDMGNSLHSVNLGGVKAIDIAAGAGHTCATLFDGGVRCWGDNFYGQLGQGVSTEKIGTAPQDLENLKNISLGSGGLAEAVTASQGAFSCVLLQSGAVKCFGKTVADESGPSPFHGLLGACWARANYNSEASLCWNAPQLAPSAALGYFGNDMGEHLPSVSLGAGAVQLASGAQFNCVVLSDGSVRCWGMNDRGQLGNGTDLNVGSGQHDMGANLKAAIPAGGGVVEIATGNEHACAVMVDNTVKCWGGSTEGATGLNLDSKTPVEVYSGK
ncbi:MAG: hypothetical protein A2603_05625 [Bdellovibrionales bacterium RIFOXYD1_FULL_55_31]|nr:MAG: hypothetical protein A2603_05625 [Bdellovibrionales bacterium RIFOXYD1_FULL_55_31]